MNKRIYSTAELQAMILPIQRRYNADHTFPFGSYAGNEATAHSDIDLLVVGNPAFRPFGIFAIAEELHECSGKHMDVYEINEMKKDPPVYRTATAEQLRCILKD